MTQAIPDSEDLTLAADPLARDRDLAMAETPLAPGDGLTGRHRPCWPLRDGRSTHRVFHLDGPDLFANVHVVHSCVGLGLPCYLPYRQYSART